MEEYVQYIKDKNNPNWVKEFSFNLLYNIVFEVEKSISLEQSVEMKVTNIQSDKYKNWLAEGNTPLEQDNVKQMVDQYKVDLPVYMRNSVIKSVLAEFEKGLKRSQSLFNNVGQTLIIDEEQMASATALCACGVAFFLRAIRAASQGGIEIGFHSEEAFTIAAQTARGAATLLLDNDAHPEAEIDRVTTPMGATIAGLNEMEHRGFSSAMIKGITTSTEKVARLFQKD